LASAKERREGAMPGSMILKAFLLSIITASISFFIAHSQLLEDLREWIQERSKFFGDLFSCCYCLSHWVAVIMVIIFSVRLFDCGWVGIDIVLTILAVAWFAGLQSMAMIRLWGD